MLVPESLRTAALLAALLLLGTACGRPPRGDADSRLHPDLAESWAVGQGGLEYTSTCAELAEEFGPTILEQFRYEL